MFRSWIFLGFNLLIAQLKRIFGMRRGEKDFLKNYIEDGIHPISSSSLDVIYSMEKCISCGYCEIKGKKGVSLIPHITRDLSQYDSFSIKNLLSGEEECPFGVQLSKSGIQIYPKEKEF